MNTPPLAAILGASGFLGRRVAALASRAGWRLKLGCRSPAQAVFLQAIGQTGQSAVFPADFARPESIERLVDGADIIINCAGTGLAGGRRQIELLYHQGPHHLAERAAAARVKHFVHISALNASPKSQSACGHAKWRGEQKIRQAFPAAQIIRPSLLFGPGGAFFARFAAMAGLSPIVPLIDYGRARFQPLAVEDAAAAAVLLAQKLGEGKIWEVGGPDIYDFRALLKWMFLRLDKKRLLIPVPLSLARLAAIFSTLAPGVPRIAPVQLRTLRDRDFTISAAAIKQKRDMEGLGLTPLALESTPVFF